ncbi:MAG: PAS domain S-box protein [bacterium]
MNIDEFLETEPNKRDDNQYILELEDKIKSLNSLRIINRHIFDNDKNPKFLYDTATDNILTANYQAALLYSTDISLITKIKLDSIDPFLVKEINNIKNEYLNKKVNLVYERFITSTGEQKLFEIALSPIKAGNKIYTLIEILNLEAWDFAKDTIKNEFIKENNITKQQLEREVEKRKIAETKLNSAVGKINLITNLKDSFFYTIRVISTSRFQLIEASKTFKKLTGYEIRDVEDLGGWSAIINSSDIGIFHKLRLKLAPNEISWGEYKIIDKNGENVWLRDYMLPQFDESGRFIQYIQGFAEDITKVKKIEEDFEKIKYDESRRATPLDLTTLKASYSNKLELKEALENYQKVIFWTFPFQIYHDSGVILDANTEFQNITNIIINPLTKKTMFEIFDSENRGEYMKRIQLNFSGLFEVKIKDKNGSIIKFEALNIMNDYRGRMVKLLAMRNPVTYQ